MAGRRKARAATGAAAPAPVSSTAPNTPSPASLAMAATFRAFDPELSDDEVHRIALGIDETRTGGVLDAGTRPLRNSDEMAARFAAEGV